jgi:hypothetical protein
MALILTALLAATLFELYGVAHCALWLGLNLRKPSQAFSRTVLLVLVLPLLPMAACFVLWPFLPFVLAAKSLLVATTTQDRMIREFRNAVTGRFDTPGGERAAVARKSITLPPVMRG